MRGDRSSTRLRPELAGATAIALGVAAIALGVAAIALPYLEAGVRPSIPDALVGWTLVGTGLILVDRGLSPTGWLIAASGFAWFAVDFAPLLSGAPRSALESGALVHLALLVHGLLGLPSGRVAGRVQHLTVALVYGVAVAAGLGSYRIGLVAAGAAIAAAAGHRWATSRSAGTRSRTIALGAGLVLGTGTFAIAILRLTASSVSEQVLTRGSQLSIVIAAVLVASVGSEHPADGTRFDLGIASVSALESAIGAALSTGPITVRFPAADGRWINPVGDFVAIEIDRMTIIREHGESGRVLAALGGSGEIGPAVPAAGLLDLLRLAGAQARLQVELQSRLFELTDSRRRLLDAGDAERRQLERQLRDGALARLATVDGLIRSTDGLEALRERVESTRIELDGVARGIDPLAGRCLKSALDQMASRSALDVTVDDPAVEPPAHIARAVWYTCSEAIANAAKHAPDCSVSITLRDDGSAITLDVEDDGPGGADPDGSGLRGLADRAAALGGSFRVDTSDAGTQIALCVPLSTQG